MYCRNCGSEISDNAFVCLKCGVKVKDDPTVITPINAGGSGAASSSSSANVTIIQQEKKEEESAIFPLVTFFSYIIFYPLGFILNLFGLASGKNKRSFRILFTVFFLAPITLFLAFYMTSFFIDKIS